MNPLGKLGNKIRYLTFEEQKYVIDNVQPEGVDTSKLTESIQNFKQNKLTLDFIHGLFDGDGSLSVYFVNASSSVCSQDQVFLADPSKVPLYIGFSFTIVQDSYNLELLNEIKSYFNDVGGIYEINKNCSIYKLGSKSVLFSVVLPKMVGKNPQELVRSAKNCSVEELDLPIIKYNKIYYSLKILERLSDGLNKENLNEIIMLSYHVRQEADDVTLEEYVEKVKRKFLL